MKYSIIIELQDNDSADDQYTNRELEQLFLRHLRMESFLSNAGLILTHMETAGGDLHEAFGIGDGE